MLRWPRMATPITTSMWHGVNAAMAPGPGRRRSTFPASGIARIRILMRTAFRHGYARPGAIVSILPLSGQAGQILWIPGLLQTKGWTLRRPSTYSPAGVQKKDEQYTQRQTAVNTPEWQAKRATAWEKRDEVLGITWGMERDDVVQRIGDASRAHIHAEHLQRRTLTREFEGMSADELSALLKLKQERLAAITAVRRAEEHFVKPQAESAPQATLRSLPRCSVRTTLTRARCSAVDARGTMSRTGRGRMPGSGSGKPRGANFSAVLTVRAVRGKGKMPPDGGAWL